MPLRRRASLRLGALAVVATLALAASGHAVSSQPPLDDEPAWGSRPEEAQTERLYRAVFGRLPDSQGFEYWLKLRTSGLTLETVAGFFVDSAEYRARFGVVSDGEFIERLYGNVLERPADDPGRSYWLAVLDTGVSRSSLVILFSESPEFVELTNTELAALPTFTATEHAVTEESLGLSWHPGCPVDPVDLRELRILHVGFGGVAILGRLVVHRTATADAIHFFETMYEHRIPIESMTPASEFDGDDIVMMESNNTSGFNCRRVTGGVAWSQHAFGRAIDINPLYNPYVSAGTVLPATGAEWVDRDRYHPSMLRGGGPLVASVIERGWRWGGQWNSLKDYQHIDLP